jgi:DNA-binding NarL/FixJ family response regulator
MDNRRRLLIVDDEAMLLSNLKDAANDEGYDADCAADGLVALSLLEKNRYDLVVTDMRMPNVDGLGLMGRLREMTPPPSVIAITGYASLETAVECLRNGAADFLVKPFEVSDFLESVRKVMARSAAPVHRDPDWDAVEKRYGLTSRQGEVLKAFYRTGKSNRDLADDLFLSPHTVKSHLKASFEKIGVTSRAQLLKALRELENT